jgi:hypothetical protein
MMIGALREISPLVIEKVVKTALKTIKKGKYTTAADIEGISNMYAMEFSHLYFGARNYKKAYTKYRKVILAEVKKRIK